MAENSSDLVVESYNLTKIYQNRQIALNDVTLKLEPGTVLGLLGHNGAGGISDDAGNRTLRRGHRGQQRGQDAHSVGAAVPIRYAIKALREKSIGWGKDEVKKQ